MALRNVLIAAATVLVAMPVLAEKKKPASPAKEELPTPARQILRPWMKEHRTDARRLLDAVLLLDHAQTEKLARQIADTDSLARSPPADINSVNSQIPKHFFELQDQLRSAAGKLADAAHRRDDLALGKEFGGLTQSCVACHAVYLNPKQ